MPELIFLEPVFAHTIWGGKRLREEFNYKESGDDIGECWGIAAHPNGDCTVLSGTYRGMKLSELYDSHREIFGGIADAVFPLLIKIIDANADLSIQVHPSDAYARTNENGSLGKTECWYILDCPAEAKLVIGHNATTKEELCRMIDNGEWDSFIRKIAIKPGDFIQINPGTVHAITAGCLLLETQQNSDITYRVYDYDRLQNGKKRPLHVEKSKAVITVPSQSEGIIDASSINGEIYSNDFYAVSRIEVKDKLKLEGDWPFLNCSVIAGSGFAAGIAVKKGDHFIVPADFGPVNLEGDLVLITSSVKNTNRQ